ncbi:hypothetical protein T492DRAFT_1022104 [Pavlovales sp. CCMP2436]|nr:hypothetical protein T492DRAFT_1022104 [Pavlovales sp. CCMP2436]|mmetsp:Transcript_12967/g.32918  ORF Transcript_12967/g.32918 Transcript_12967/m.32918 type:complete len:271 (-) Transcript_12967:46-858(-)
MLLELVNCSILACAGTEVLLWRPSSGVRLRAPLAAAALANALLSERAQLLLLRTEHGALVLAHHTLDAASVRLRAGAHTLALPGIHVAGWLGSPAVLALAAALALALHRIALATRGRRFASPRARPLLLVVALFVALLALEQAGVMRVPHGEAAKVVPVGVFFTAVCYWDVSRRITGSERITPAQFAAELGIACGLILPCFPLIAIALACVLLVVIAFFESAHLDTAILNAPIYYVVLYGPFACVYFLTKYRCIDELSKRLPTSSSIHGK